MHHRTKFGEDWSNRSGDMADFRFFKMTAAAILDFGNFKFLTFGTLKRVELLPACQILSTSLKPRLRYGDFSIFQDGGRPPSWIGFTRVGTIHDEYLVIFVTVQNLVVFSAVISIVCKFSYFAR